MSNDIDWSKAPEGTTHALVDITGKIWEKWTDLWVYQWQDGDWKMHAAVGICNVDFRIPRPTNTGIPCKVKKLRPNAQLPVRATKTAAGYDVHYSPPNHQKVDVYPDEVRPLPTGLAFEMPADVAMLVLPRSGLAGKRQLRPANTPGLVDSDYRGELIVLMENFGTEPQRLQPGERIAQLVFINPLVMDFTEVDELSDTERGEGGFGSTGTK